MSISQKRAMQSRSRCDSAFAWTWRTSTRSTGNMKTHPNGTMKRVEGVPAYHKAVKMRAQPGIPQVQLAWQKEEECRCPCTTVLDVGPEATASWQGHKCRALNAITPSERGDPSRSQPGHLRRVRKSSFSEQLCQRHPRKPGDAVLLLQPTQGM